MKRAMDIRNGNLIIYEGIICRVEEVETKGSAKAHKTFNIKMRSILEGKYVEHTFNPEDKIDEADVTQKKALYSYKDETSFYFLDEETYENYQVAREMVGDKEAFLKENERYAVTLYKTTPIEVTFPERIRIKVASAPPGIKQHDSTTAKKVTLENGMELDVPQFIGEGDMVEVAPPQERV